MSRKTGKNAWDYLDMAYEAGDEAAALKYAQKAFQLDHNCLDAEVMIAELTTEDSEELKLKYEKMISKVEAHLAKEGLFNDESRGSFWGIIETRPYMRLRYSYLNLLIGQGKFKKAIKECEDMLELSENDNMGVRYLLISLYAFFEDEFNVSKLHKRFGKEAGTHMILPIIALYYKLDNYKKAEIYLKKLYEVNGELADFFFNTDTLDEEEIDDIIDNGMYRYGSKEEILMAMTDSSFLYSTMNGFLPWMAERISQL